MKTTEKYNKSEIMKEATAMFNETAYKLTREIKMKSDMTIDEWFEATKFMGKRVYKSALKSGIEIITNKELVKVNGSLEECIIEVRAKYSENVNQTILNDINDIFEIAKAANGKVWNNRIYFNGNFGSVYAEKTDTNWTLEIKRSDITEFNGQMLNAMLDDKANELTNLGLTLR